MEGLSRRNRPTDQAAIAGLDRSKVSQGFGRSFRPLAEAHGMRRDFAFATQVEPGVDRQPV